MNPKKQKPIGMSDEHRGYRDAGEYRRRLLTSVWPYVVVVMVVFGISILAARDLAWPLFAAGWAVAAVSIAIAYLHPQLWLIAPFGAMASVLLIRWGTDGLASGVGPLLLVPVVAIALYGSRRALAAILLLAGLAVVGAHLGTHRAELALTPVWRQDLIMLAMAAVLSAAVNDLVNRLRSERRLSESRETHLETVSEITRAIATSVRPTRTLCRRAVELTGAGAGALFRRQAGEPELLAWENADPDALRKLGAGPIRELMDESDPGDRPPVRILDRETADLDPFRSAWIEVDPVALVCLTARSNPHSTGLLILAWPEGPPPGESDLPFDLLADEASIAIRNHELTERLERLALTDPLTGVANRRGWEEQIAGALATAARHRRPVSMAMLDLDGFKAFNDRHGHQAGDRLLLECVERWKGLIRGGDQLARYGGDEFVLVLPETTIEKARIVVERMCRSAEQSVGCSAGVAEWDGTEPATDLLRRADRALYAAKAEGPGQVRTADQAGELPGT